MRLSVGMVYVIRDKGGGTRRKMWRESFDVVITPIFNFLSYQEVVR